MVTQNKQVVSESRKQTDEDEDQGRETWTPTPEIFAGFLKRDQELAVSNLLMAMSSNKFPMSLRDLKDCLLHSVDVIERVLTSQMASVRITMDANSKYSLVP